MVCTVRLYAWHRTSFKSSARMMGQGKPTSRLYTLMKRVFRMTFREWGEVRKSLK